jgi:hypothetical protein
MARADRRSLAGGAVVETRLCARLLGVKLLVVDGTVTLVPGRPVEPGEQIVVPVAWADVEHHPVAPRGEVNGADSPFAQADVGPRLEACVQRLETSARILRGLRSP